MRQEDATYVLVHCIQICENDSAFWMTLLPVWHGRGYCSLGVNKRNIILNSQQWFWSSYVGSLASRVHDVDEVSEVAHLKQLNHRNDPETVIRLFESQPSLHYNTSPLSEYVKALVKVDRLDENELLKTLHRGIGNSAMEEKSIGGLAALRNVGKRTKDGILGTAVAPIHMVFLVLISVKVLKADDVHLMIITRGTLGHRAHQTTSTSALVH